MGFPLKVKRQLSDGPARAASLAEESPDSSGGAGVPAAPGVGGAAAPPKPATLPRSPAPASGASALTAVPASPASPPGARVAQAAAREKAIAFSRAEQLVEIFSEAHRLKLQVLIRTSATGKAIRGVVEGFDPRDKTLRVGSISPAGDQLLRGHDLVKIEFILLSKKLVFVSPVRARVAGKILLGLPDKIVAIERRVNARFRVPATHAAFIDFPERMIDFGRFDAPFVPMFMREEQYAHPRLRIDDVSLGGVACFTRYGAVAEPFRAEEQYVNANLHFPGHAPILVPMAIRWTKRTTSALAPGRFEQLQRVLATRFRPSMSPEDADMRETFFRMGLQFHEVPKELDTALRHFIRLVQAAESV